MAGNIVDNGLVQFDYNGAATIPGAFTGGGSAEAVAGTVVITGGSAIGGNVTIDPGATMQWGDGGPGFLVGAGNAIIDNGALVMNFGGGGIAGAVPISGSGTVELVSGSLSDSGVSTYTGTTTIDAAGFLALTGAGSISNSSDVIDNGTFDISGTAGTSITTLDGSGIVSLGAQTLTLTAASGTFSGDLADGGLSGGVGGALTIAAGTETLTGANTYTGVTTIDLGATLALGDGVSNGTVAGDIVDNGLVQFDYNGAATIPGAFTGGGSAEAVAGTVVITGDSAIGGNVTIDPGATMQWGAGAPAFLVGGGNAVIDNGALVLNFGGGGVGGTIPISGTGTFELVSGSLNNAGVSTYTGTTTIDPAGFLLLNGAGSIANSSDVIDNGTFDISGTTAGASITSLDGSGGVSLGGQLLTLTNASGTFGGVLADGGISGGTGGQLTIAGGTETLTGVNTFTGLTTVADGATLDLVGAGSIADSGDPLVNGTFDISGAAPPGSSIISLSGHGHVILGENTLTLTAAADLFSGFISGDGGLTIAAGTEALSGVNTFTGTTLIDPVATLQLGDGAGNMGLLAGPITDNGALLFNGGAATDSIFATSITGTGDAEVVSGIVGLTGTNTYTGPTQVDVGATLQLGEGGTTGTVEGLIVDNGLVQFNYSGPVTSDNGFVGGGSVEVVAGTVVYTGSGSTVGGAVTIDPGATLQWGDGNPTFLIGGGNAVIDNGALVLNFGGGGVGGTIPISGTGTFELVSGSLNNLGVSTYTGTTTIDPSGFLLLSGAGSISDSSNVIDNGNFDISGVTAGTSIVTLSGSGNVALGAQTLTLTDASGTFSGVLADGGLSGGTGGALTIAAGTETLTGTNTFTGPTTIDLGATLDLGNGGPAGSVAGDIVDNGVLQFNYDDSVTIPGAISGGGSAEVVAGTAVVTGLSIVGSDVTIDPGATLQWGDGAPGFLLGGGDAVVDNGLLLLDFGGGGVSGAIPISGTGALEVQSGAFIDSGVSTYTGTTTIDPGAAFRLNGTGSIADSSNVIDNGQFDIFGTTAGASIITLSGAGGVSLGAQTLTLTNASGTFSGMIADGGFGGTGGGLTIAGGTETLTGANIFTGLTTVASGATLNLGAGGTSGSVAGNIVDNGTLNLNRSNLQIIGQSISGTGALNQIGTGFTILDGFNPLTGLTTISAGTLEVGDGAHPGATLGGNVVVGANGRLEGHGTIAGSVSNIAGGVVAPGGTIGTLTVGSYTQGPTSTLAIEVAPTVASQLNSLGAASLNGHLALTFDPGVYTDHVYDILNGHPVTGTFSTITAAGSVGPGNVFGVFYTPTQVDLVTEATAHAQIYGGVSAATLDRAQNFATLVEDRFGDAGCPDGSADRSATGCHGYGAWAYVIGSWNNQSTDGSAFGFTNDGVGVVAGLDRATDNGSLVGLSFGYTQNDLSMGVADAKASGPSYYGAVYGRLVDRGMWFDGEVFYMHTDWSVDRVMPGLGVATSNPNADSEGFLLQASLPIGDTGLRPYARFTYVLSDRGGVLENGVGPLGYQINPNTQSAAVGEIGFLYSPTFTTGGGMQVRPALKVGVQDNAGDRGQTVTGSLFGITGTAFEQVGPRLWGVAGVVDGSLKVRVNQSLELFGDINGRFGEHQTDGVASVGGVIRF